jgi:hypothetical protein
MGKDYFKLEKKLKGGTIVEIPLVFVEIFVRVLIHIE